PRISYSNRRGFQYEQAYFWAIDKSSDATLGVDVETAARVGALAEYRYALSRGAHGQFLLAYYNERIRGRNTGTRASEPIDTPENRFAIAGRHVSPFYDGSKLYLDMLAVSDRSFLREMNSFGFAGGGSLGLRTARYTTSRVGLIKTWDDGLVQI